MTHEETRAFLLEGTRTAKLGVVRKDGWPYVAPVWFVRPFRGHAHARDRVLVEVADVDVVEIVAAVAGANELVAVEVQAT